MIKHNMLPSVFCALLALLVFGAPQAGATGMDKTSSPRDICSVVFGTGTIEISGYQPDYSQEKYCNRLPSTGRTIFVFDLSAPTMRDLPVEIRIVKDSVVPLLASGEGTAVLEAHAAPEARKHGIFTIEHNFAESGHFITLVTLTRPNGERNTAQFKFSVGQTFLRLAPLLMGGVLMGVALLIYWRHGSRQPKSSELQQTP